MKINTFADFRSLLLVVFALSACGPSPEQAAREAAIAKLERSANEMQAAGKRAEAAANRGDVGAAMGEAMNVLGSLSGAAGVAGAGSYDPVDFRKLKEALPKELAGFEKGDSSGEKNNAFGIAVSEATTSFRTADGSKSVRFQITDPGSLTGPFAMANVWMNLEVDKESSDGYEKTSSINGRKLHETWTKSSKQGVLDVVIANRFLVAVNGRGVEMNEIKTLLAQIDLAKLEAMKSEGKKS